MATVYYDYLQTPVGRLMLAADSHGLRHVDFENGKYPAAISEDWERGPNAEGIDAGRNPSTEVPRSHRVKGERHPRSDRQDGGDRRPTTIWREARAQLTAYFAGELIEFDLPLAPQGTEFQKQVWLALRRIPFGATTTYGEIARALGDAGAVRAVGAANGRNPLPIIVPCHRVIGANGSLTGFGGGLPVKRWLLDHEQRHSAFALTP